MPSYRKIDLAYAAGLFDAEGCVVTSRHRRTRSTQYLLSCVVVNTHHGVIEWLRHLFAGNIVYRAAHGNQREHWRWSVWCNDAVNFLKLIGMYTVLKGHQAAAGCMLQTSPREGRYHYFSMVRRLNGQRGAATCQDFSKLTGRLATAYSAGFYDGEGNCHVAVTKAGYEDTNLQVGNTELSVLQWLRSRYTGSIRSRAKDKSRIGYRELWTWTLKSAAARRFLSQVGPYLKVKAPTCRSSMAP